MNPLLLILFTILTLQAIAFVIAIIARYWVLRSESFELHGINVERATNLVAGYLAGVHDHRFGFPTGVFEIDDDRTEPGQVVAREINLRGSAGMAPIRFGISLPFLGAAAGFAMGADADDAGAGCMVSMLGGWLGFMLGLAAAAVLVIPFAFLAMVEILLRMLMRGEVLARIDEVAGEGDSVRVRFEMRGLSAFGVEHQLRRGMAPPQPEGAPRPPTAPIEVDQSPVARFDRLNAIYLAAVSIGLLISVSAFIVIGNTQTGSAGADSSYYGYEEEPYEEEGYEEEPYEEEPYEEEGYEEEPYEEEPYEEEGGYDEEEAQGYAPTRFVAAKRTFRRYWTAIDEGRYGAAYGIYYRTFRVEKGITRREFSAAEHRYLPDVGLERMTITRSSRNPTNPNELWLYVEVPIRDGAGDFAGECRLFYGDVRMFHADGRWYYRPGEAFGRKPSFGREGGGIRVLPSYSERCDY